jgi:hypothetical protein
MRPLLLSLELLRLLEQSMIMMRQLCNAHLLATEGSPAVFEFSLSNPSAEDTTYTFTFTNGTAGGADYTTTSQTTVPAGATTGECTNNCRYD